MAEHSEESRRVFDEVSLHQDIIKTWGEHGAHNDVFTEMRKAQRRSQELVDSLRRRVDRLEWALNHPTTADAEALRAELSGSSGGEQ